MKSRYVIDTTSLISFFPNVFKKESKISKDAIQIIENAFNDSNVILYFPSIVFIEIFSKFFVNEEQAGLIRYEVFEKINNQKNMSIEPIDIEVLEAFMQIRDIEPDFNFDNHDKQVFATAMKYNCPLITSDTKLIRYNKKKGLIPSIIC